MNVDYLTGNESPTADRMNDLFAALDAKLTKLLGGRSFFMAQTATMPPYLVGKTFFFTAGGAIYAPRIPGYIETNTSTQPVARPYNHNQFVAQQNSLSALKGYLTGVSIANMGTGYNDGDILTLIGGDGAAATIRVTSAVITTHGVAEAEVAGIGNYNSVPVNPISVSGGSGTGCTVNATFSSPGYDVVNKVATVPMIPASAYQGLPQAGDVGFFEWSLAAHYLMYQGAPDKMPVRYYIQEGIGGRPQGLPEKRFRFALAEIVIEGVSTVTIEKSWDKYACFRFHNLNSTPARVVFEDGNYTVNLTPFQCATLRRDWNADANHYENYRSGFNYFFKYEGGDPRFYWFFPTAQRTGANVFETIAWGDKAANSMQANNLTNPAILLDWIQYFQRTPDSSLNLQRGAAGIGSIFCGWQEDASVQCDIYSGNPQMQALFGDPSNPKTLVGDLIHHKGDILILRRPKKLYQLQSFTLVSRGKNYSAGDLLLLSGGVTLGYAAVTVDTVDASGGILSASIAENGAYVTPPPSYNQLIGDPLQPTNGSGAIINAVMSPMDNWIAAQGGIFGAPEKLRFNGYVGIVEDFAKAQLSVKEDGNGNLVITSLDPANDVFLFPVSTNLFKTGETLPLYVDLSGTNGFTIENAIFETNPEQSWVSNPGLSNAAPNLIQHPKLNITTSSQSYMDFYDLIHVLYNPEISYTGQNPDPDNYTYTATVTDDDGNLFVVFWRNPIQQNGQPQSTLDWTANTTGIGLNGATVVDGGSGYQVGDILQPGLGTQSPNYAPQVNRPANIEVTKVINGRIAPNGIKIIDPGSYGFVASPNAVTGGSGSGAILSFTTANTFNGLHKKTVADLLTLDWWGNPAIPGQSNEYVIIENRKLWLTPQGLVITFTETDSTLQGNPDAPANMPGWSSGHRSLTRNRQIHFRQHGWGYVGVANDGLPPSSASGIFSPTRGRQEAIGTYTGEVVAPNGEDFSIKGLSFSKPSAVKMLKRLVMPNDYDSVVVPQPVLNQTKKIIVTHGRFWTLSGDAIYNLIMQNPAILKEGQLADVMSSPLVLVNIYIIDAPSLTNVPSNPQMAMALVVEMYNQLARAVNSLTSGVPLSWQCLCFNVDGYVVNLDPTYGSFPPHGLGSGEAYTGPTGYGGWAGYYGVMPMDQFCCFDEATLYEKLCQQLGIPVRTEGDFPGGFEGGAEPRPGTYQPFGFFQGKFTLPAVSYDFSNLANVQLNIQSDGSYTGTVDVTLETELLSAAAIGAGRPTGSHCLGTYDPAKYVVGDSYDANGNLIASQYPSFTGAAPGSYYIASDGSGKVAITNGTVSEFFYWITGNLQPQSYYGTNSGEQYIYYGQPISQKAASNDASSAYGLWVDESGVPAYKGLASVPGSLLGVAPNGGWPGAQSLTGGVNLNGFSGYRWIEITDVQAMVERFGFPFVYAEAVTPLTLKYFADPTTQSVVGGGGSGAYPIKGTITGVSVDTTTQYPPGIVGAFGFRSVAAIELLEQFIASQVKASPSYGFSPEYSVGHGTLIKFCVAASNAADWKLPTFSPPTKVANLASRQSLSPFFRYLDAQPGFSGQVSISWEYASSNPPPLYTGGEVQYIGRSGGLDYYLLYFGGGGDTGFSLGFANPYPTVSNEILLGKRPSGIGDVAQLAVMFNGGSVTDLIATNNDRETNNFLYNEIASVGFNLYASGTITPVPVVMNGQPAWVHQMDWWDNLDKIYAMTDGSEGNLANLSGVVPWTFLPPPSDYRASVGQGLTVIACGGQQNYLACYDLSNVAIRLTDL